MKQKRLVLSTGAALLVLFGLAGRELFSLSSSPNQSGDNRLQAETSLLISHADGLLADKDCGKVIKNVDYLIVKNYSVGPNDWLEKIAQQYGVPAIYFRSTNNLEDSSLRLRQQVIVYNKRGMVHIAKAGESVEAVILFYEKIGAKREKILAGNAWDEITEIREGVLCLKDGAKLLIPGARKSYPIFFRPVVWSRISSLFGFRRHPILKTKRFHDGFDLVAPYGAPVRASENGVVTYAGWMGGYGNLVEIRHKNITTRYGHLSKVLVEVGQIIKQKRLIGNVGSTGLSTGAHLHFEVRRNADGKLLNPRKYLF